MGRKSRQKGKRGEREACDLLRERFPNVRRSAMQARGGLEQPDLLCTPGWWVEVGVGRVNPRTKWEQAERDRAAAIDSYEELTMAPLALTKSDRGEWLVTVSWVVFEEILAEAEEAQK